MTRPPLLGASLEERAPSEEAAAAARLVLGEGQTVAPLMPWQSTLTNDEPSAQTTLTIVFEDLFGNPFGYVNHVSRHGTAESLEELWWAHDPSAPLPEDESSWTHATYVSGVNTRRSVVGAYFHGYPLLDGLLGTEARAAGVTLERVDRFVMPDENSFWVQLDDGRYYDLESRGWITADVVDAATDSYESVLIQNADNLGAFKADATTRWRNATLRGVRLEPSACDLDPDECIEDITITPRVLETGQSCRQVGFLWWAWEECDRWSHGYFDDIHFQIAKYDYQYLHEGRYWGCGPASAAAMLWWWKVRNGHDTIDDDFDPSYLETNDAAYRRAAVQLIDDMNAFGEIFWLIGLTGKQRATYQGDYRPGLQTYLDRRDVDLRARSIWGVGSIYSGAIRNRLAEVFDNAHPVPVVGGEFSASNQHYGVLKGFHEDAFGGLRGDLLAPLSSTSTLNLDGLFNLAGIWWIEER